MIDLVASALQNRDLGEARHHRGSGCQVTVGHNQICRAVGHSRSCTPGPTGLHRQRSEHIVEKERACMESFTRGFSLVAVMMFSHDAAISYRSTAK